jgi:hypothetical protein
MKARIANVNTFLDPAAAARKAPGGKTNTLLSMLQIIEALQACLNDYNESSAGFVFEGFMAALTAGEQIAGRIGGTLPIEDFVAFSEIDAAPVPTSLKLLSPKTGIHGSFTNLMDYLFVRSEKPEQPESDEQTELQEQKERQHGNKDQLNIWLLINRYQEIVLKSFRSLILQSAETILLIYWPLLVRKTEHFLVIWPLP